ncbi:hypothetical protein [Macrococcoides canis]|uniref:hypothetical protein n=1 Tax=Macrococcoides canis TaxID=1855823 RepID=UPI0022B8E00C|nr:hypothetical protein [Macrococcus canis]WBF54013.1 hypothetical protein LL975_11965 [Macrococcus canis]
MENNFKVINVKNNGQQVNFILNGLEGLYDNTSDRDAQPIHTLNYDGKNAVWSNQDSLSTSDFIGDEPYFNILKEEFNVVTKSDIKERYKDEVKDRNVIVHFPGLDPNEIKEIYNSYDWLKYNNDVTLCERDGQIFKNQTTTEFKNRSYLEIDEENKLTPTDVYELRNNIEMEIGFEHDVRVMFVEETSSKLQFINDKSLVGFFNLDKATYQQKEFIFDSYQYFKETGNTFFIDNVFDGKPIDIEEFIALNKDNLDFINRQKNNDLNLEISKTDLANARRFAKENYGDVEIKIDKDDLSNKEFQVLNKDGDVIGIHDFEDIEYITLQEAERMIQQKLEPLNMTYQELKNDLATIHNIYQDRRFDVDMKYEDLKDEVNNDMFYDRNIDNLDAAMDKELEEVKQEMDRNYDLSSKEAVMRNIQNEVLDNLVKEDKRTLMNKLDGNDYLNNKEISIESIESEKLTPLKYRIEDKLNGERICTIWHDDNLNPKYIADIKQVKDEKVVKHGQPHEYSDSYYTEDRFIIKDFLTIEDKDIFNEMILKEDERLKNVSNIESHVKDRLDVLEKKIGLNQKGDFNQPIIHIKETNQVMPLKVLSKNIKSKDFDTEAFTYEIYTNPHHKLFDGDFNVSNNKTVMEQVKIDADLNGVPDVYQKSLDNMKKHSTTKEQVHEKSIELS